MRRILMACALLLVASMAPAGERAIEWVQSGTRTSLPVRAEKNQVYFATDCATAACTAGGATTPCIFLGTAAHAWALFGCDSTTTSTTTTTTSSTTTTT